MSSSREIIPEIPEIPELLSEEKPKNSKTLIKKAKAALKTKCIPTNPKKRAKILAKYGFSGIPASIDGAGYAILTFAQLLTMLYSLKLMDEDPEKLKEFERLATLLPLPVIAGLGVAALDAWENKTLLNGNFPEDGNGPTKIELVKAIIGFLRNHPALVLNLLVAAALDGVIVQSNIGYLTNQFNVFFAESGIDTLSIIFCTIIGMQFFIVNAPSLVELVEEGYTLNFDYTKAINNRLLRHLAKAYVNFTPIISAFITGALGGSESYQLVQYWISQLEPEDIANRLAIPPAVLLGLLGLTCHFGLYGLK